MLMCRCSIPAYYTAKSRFCLPGLARIFYKLLVSLSHVRRIVPRLTLPALESGSEPAMTALVLTLVYIVWASAAPAEAQTTYNREKYCNEASDRADALKCRQKPAGDPARAR